MSFHALLGRMIDIEKALTAFFSKPLHELEACISTKEAKETFKTLRCGLSVDFFVALKEVHAVTYQVVKWEVLVQTEKPLFAMIYTIVGYMVPQSLRSRLAYGYQGWCRSTGASWR